MNSSKRAFLSVVIGLVGMLSHATTYYISHNGNDANSGTSPDQAWRTIARYQQMMYTLQPGDQVLFERGGIYPGIVDVPVSGSASQPIVIGAYGNGEKPVISGGVPVNNWIQHSGNIWRAELSTAPKYVLVNGEPITLARFPNTGYLRNQQGSNSHITCPELNQNDGAWTGATVTIRATNWSFENAVINSSSSNGTITFNPITIDLANNDWGFFLSGKLSQLDMAGEWAYENGQLFMWAPDNADPNDLEVLASIHNKGVIAHWNRQHIRIQDLTIQGQTTTAISTEVASNVTVTGCEIRYSYLGVQSSGTNNSYINNHFHNTFASAMDVYDDTGALIENNTFNAIAIRPGMGEDIWGYWAIRVTGSDAIVRGNRLNNIGYIGIDVKNNTLVENNVVVNATSILNDGAGISFDNCDGAIIRNNIVRDCVGNMESVATSHIAYYPIIFGIYFGNTSIKNTTVQGNTVTRCNGAGIHVDHTQVSEGNRILDNLLFDNNVQLSLSDASNTTGPGAAPPYYVPHFNDEYSGNIMYSIRPEQLCMRQFHVHSPLHVDYGTWSNNKYFNPYNELSIMIHNHQGGGMKHYTLESWQSTFDEDDGSSRSPLRLSPYNVTEVHGGNMIPNGNFNYDVNGWSGWPVEAQVTHDATYLDNGAMKVVFNDNSMYDLFFNSVDQMPTLQSGEFYRLKLSTRSTMQGILDVEVKNQSQLQTPYPMFETLVPFSNERRDLSIFFRSTVTEPARLQVVNHYTEGTYWLDNVRLEHVEVEEVDPYTRHILLLNDQFSTQTFDLDGCWSLIDGTLVSGSIDVPSFGSVVLQKEDDASCNLSTAIDDVASVAITTNIFHPNPVVRGGTLHLGAPAGTDIDLRLIDISGRTVSATNLRAGMTQFQLEQGIPAGMYILRSHSATGTNDQRLIVE